MGCGAVHAQLYMETKREIKLVAFDLDGTTLHGFAE